MPEDEELRRLQSRGALLIQLQISVFLFPLFLRGRNSGPPSERSAAHDSILKGFIFNLLAQSLLLYSDLQIGTSC